MNTVYGNLLTLFENGKFDIIVHGCNCVHSMGAGLAKQIKKKYPAAYAVDLTTNKNDKNKLGSYSLCQTSSNKYIINGYTEYRYGNPKNPQVDYDAIKQLFEKINCDFQGKVIGIPQIGAGLSGGDWDKIQNYK